MSSLAKSFGYNFSGQLVARTISFCINMYLLRVVGNDVLGLVNVQLTLLYQTILFLTREPLRKAHILRDSLPQFINLLWLAPLIASSISLFCTFLWSKGTAHSDDIPLAVLIAFPAAAIIESVAEPFAVISLRYSLGRQFAIGQSLLIFLQRFFVFVAIWTRPETYPLQLFAYGQLFGSSTYLLYYLVSFYIIQKRGDLKEFKTFRALLPNISAGLDKESIKAWSTMLSHSVLKQFLTDGSAFVMTFTNIMTLKQQAVYDAVERLGSLVARTVLAPMEENCYAYFANSIRSQSQVFEKNNAKHDELASTLRVILHVVGVLGLVICVFGVPYSPTAVYIYGGRLLLENGGAILLSLYSFYVWVMAINGITECFAMASMDNEEVFSHGSFLFLAAIGHLTMNLVLSSYFSSAGFIAANVINMVARIVYSWKHIKAYLGQKSPSVFIIFPDFNIIASLLFCFMATSFSYLLFATTPGFSHSAVHVAIGGVLCGLLLTNVAQNDAVFVDLIANAIKTHKN